MAKNEKKPTGFQFTTPQAVIIAGIIIAAGIYLSNRGAITPSGTVAEQEEQLGEIAGEKVVDISVDDDPSYGAEDSPVTMIEFSSFTCGYCGLYHRETFPKIEEEYIKTGKVRYVYRDFPLGESAQLAHCAFQCANEQGKFWEYVDVLFKNQGEQDEEGLKKFAVDLGADGEDFAACLSSGKYKDEIQKDLEDGQKAGVEGTPSFFINGRLVVGAQPYSEFKRVIDEELAK